MHKINTVLFDLDGTLIDSNELIIDSFRYTFKKYMPNREFTRKELIEMIGPPLVETFKIATDKDSIIQEMIVDYRKFYVENEFEYVRLYPHVIELLEFLKNAGINLAIVTTKYSRSALPGIEHFGLDKYIKAYSFLDDVNNHKPHPEPVIYALNKFENVDKAIMVGDNSSDIIAGKNAGIMTCAVNWSIRKELLDNLDPDYRINDFLDLIDILKKYNEED